jgi:RND family efflux transporter MFP subunit
MKRIVIAVAVVAIAGVLWLSLHGGDKSETSASSAVAKGQTQSAAKVERRTIDVAVEGVGEINPANLVTVKPEVGGRIQTIHVVTGQAIRKGDPLVSLDDTDLLTERSSAQTEIAGTQVQLEKAQRDYERNRDLFASKLVSLEVFENSKTTLELARNEFEKSQKRLQGVEDKLKKIHIVAPFDGTVLTVSVGKGQVVSGATGVTQGTELMTFADLNEMIIRAHITQVDVTKIQLDQKVDITVDSIPGVTLAGKVVLIAPIAVVKNNIKGFSVDVLITRGDARVRPGMNANLRFPVAHVEGALSVPITAVFAEGKEKVVYVKTARSAERRVISIGVSDYSYCEIVNGLREGETVLLERPAPTKS